MAEQILKVKLVADVGQSEAALKLFTDSAKDAGVSIEKVFKAVNVETDKIAYDIKTTAAEIDSLDKAFKSAKAKFSEDETTKLSSDFIEVTKNIDTEAARIAKSRQKGFEEDLAKRTTRLKESLSVELALIREGENSITAIKLESASKQRKLEEKLQEDLAVVKQKFIDQDITAATKNTYINKLYADYKDATVKLNELTDERITKANQEVADFNLVEKKLAETSARRVKLVEDREKALNDIQIAAAKKSQEVQNALIKQTVDSLIITDNREYKRLLAARKANAEAAFGVGAPQASRDDRGYVPFAMGTVGGKREAEQAASASRAQTLQEAETRAFLRRRAKAEKEWADSFNTVVTPAVETNTEVLKKNKDATEQVGKAHKSMFAHVAEVVGIYSVLNTTINLTKQGLMAIPQAGIAMQQTTSTLSALFGTVKAEDNIKFIRELANTAGQSFSDLTEAYRKFAPSAVLAGASQENVNQIFKDFTETSTVLHLSTDQVKSLYLALEQMYAKTTVQSEEIKKQLGNVLPGAVEIGAKAWAGYTKSADKSVSAFMEAMRKNLVITKEFAPAFAAEYKKLFGGVDDSVFADARTKLLSNLQRIKNELFYIASDMFDITSETMNKAVKLAADLLTSVRQNLEGVLQVVTAITTVIGVNLVASIAKFVASVEGITKIGLVIGRIFNPLTLAIAGATATLGGLMEATTSAQVKYEKFTAASKEQIAQLMATYAAQKEGAQEAGMELERLTEKSKSFSIDYQGIQISFSSLFEGLTTMFSEWWDEELARSARDWEKIKTLASKAWDSIGEYIKKVLPYSTKESLSEMQGYFLDFASWVNTNVIKPIAEDLAITFDVVLQKAKVAQAEANAKIQKEKPIIFADPNLVGDDAGNVPKPTKPPKPTDTNLKQAANEKYKAVLEEIKNASKQIQADLTEALGNIDILYQQNAMSIETYFSQKIQLQETDLAVQKEMLNQELQLAYAQKDKVKIQKLNGELIKAETDANKLATKTIIEKTNATRAYQAMTLEGQAKVLAFQGRGGEAALGQFDVATRDKFEKFAIAGDTAALRNLEIERQNVALKGAIADIDEKRALQEADYQASLERTNILKNTGAIGEFTALQQITAANEARIASMEEAVRIKELEIAKTEELVGVVDLKERSALKKLREELENFRLTSDAVAQHFDKVFSDSFTNAFTGFANGTMTAQQAFSSLITSMIGEIQKLIAQEMASAALRTIIRPLANWAMGGLGGLFGGATSVAAGNSAGFASAMEGSNWMTATLANGGVMSGAGISAYSGSVVSKPTIFPFANGTGLMGEAGPEAILPLTRNSKGKLGVIADSTGQSGGNVYNIEVTVQSSKDEKPADTGQKIAEAMMRTIAKQEIGLAARPGNSLNRTTKFG
jgi:tape measure domain-containing protein